MTFDAEEYRAVQEGAGLIDLSRRGKVSVKGPDAVEFLHSMISNDVRGLSPLAGRYATFLTAQGKLVADFFVYRMPDSLLIDLETAMTENFIATLDKYVIMEEVELQDISRRWAHSSLQGPDSGRILASLTGARMPQQRLSVSAAQWRGQACFIISKGDYSQAGFEIIIEAAALADLREELLANDVLEVGSGTEHVLRLEAGIPRYGYELDETRNPLEARLDEALDFDKGCYIGQEVIAKATYIGGVSRKLVKISLDGERVPEPGSTLLGDSGRKLGKITSAAYSPSLGGPIALGYVKRAQSTVGAELRIDLGGEESVRGRIVESF